MDKLIDKSEVYDLSDSDIHRITDGQCHIIKYEDLEHVSSLEEILEPFGCVMILYQTAARFGHWVTLFRTGAKEKGKLEFFDPYGLKVDQELDIDNEFHLREHNGVKTPHLSALIAKGGYKVKSNTKQLQKILRHVQTCGRHVAMRIRFRDASLPKYIKMLTTNAHYDPDFWVSAMTLLV
jgi:hypothetical protein